MSTRWRAAGVVAILLALFTPTGAVAESALPWVFHAGATSVTGGAEMPAEYFSTVAVQVEGTFVGTVAFQKKTKDATGYALVQCTNSTTGVKATETSEPGYWECPGGAYRFQVPVTARTSGTIVVTGTGTTAVSGGRGEGGDGAWTADVTTANSLANARCIGDGILANCLYVDGTLGPVIRPKVDSNTRTYIWSGKTWCLNSVGFNSCMLTVDPLASGNARYAWAAGFHPIKTIPLPADALYPQGAATLVTDTPLIAGGHVVPYLTVTDSNTDGTYRYLTMPNDWDGGTVTATVTVVNTNATPSNALLMHVSGACYPVGTAIPTTISTTGEQPATVTFGAGGSCGASACPQNASARATTSPISINGAPAGGNVCGFQAQVDATGTTATVAGLKITQLDIHYALGQGF